MSKTEKFVTWFCFHKAKQKLDPESETNFVIRQFKKLKAGNYIIKIEEDDITSGEN